MAMGFGRTLAPFPPAAAGLAAASSAVLATAEAATPPTSDTAPSDAELCKTPLRVDLRRDASSLIACSPREVGFVPAGPIVPQPTQLTDKPSTRCRARRNVAGVNF